MLSALLIAVNQRKLGGFLLLLGAIFLLCTRDNMFLTAKDTTIMAELKQRKVDFFRNLSLIGAALLLFIHH